MERGSGRLRLDAAAPTGIALSGAAEPRCAGVLARRLERHGLRVTLDASAASAQIEFALDPHAGLESQHYELSVDPDRALLRAGDLAGLHHGACTLAQLLRPAAPGDTGLEAPGVQVSDGPDFERRGVMLDVSRDRIPTMDTLLMIIERLAAWKVNELQLYLEHTFAYAGHEEVWRDASAFTAEEIRTLDAFCHERFIELVPNQNSFGHFHRWLTLDRYAPLAELPEGIEHAFSLEPEPFSLAPEDPQTFELLEDLFDQLLPNFTSRRFNVGLDETFDLGLGRSRAACEQRGKGRVYLDYLKAIHERVCARGRSMEFWGDIIVQHPELVAHLPADATALEWGYEAGHPFEEHARQFAQSGLDFHVCPGTSSWQSLTGRATNAAINLEEAARHGLANGARGYLNTDWGDYGHWQPLAVTWPGLVLGAGRGWNAGVDPGDLASLLSEHVTGDPSGASGEAIVLLSDAYLEGDAQCVNGTAFFFLLKFAHEDLPHERVKGVSTSGLQRCADRLAAAARRMAGHKMTCSDAGLLVDEVQWAAATAQLSCRLGQARLAGPAPISTPGIPAATRAALAEDLRAATARHRELWLRRSRPGGLADSAGRFLRILPLLEASP
jgi:hexosaminidase